MTDDFFAVTQNFCTLMVDTLGGFNLTIEIIMKSYELHLRDARIKEVQRLDRSVRFCPDCTDSEDCGGNCDLPYTEITYRVENVARVQGWSHANRVTLDIDFVDKSNPIVGLMVDEFIVL